ncbi:hypothetical protein PRIC1_009491 [Phytophthora ramorum]
MEAPDRATGPVGGLYPEDILLEAYNLEWKAIELRRQRLQKTWQQFMLMEDMEEEELMYQSQLRLLEQQEEEEQEQERELAAEQEKTLRREKEKLKAEKQKQKQKKKLQELVAKQEEERLTAEAKKLENERLKAEKKLATEQEAALRRELEKETALLKKRQRLKAAKKKKLDQVAASDSQTDEKEAKERAKTKMQPKQAKKTKAVPSKRITPISLPQAVQPEDDESFSEENQVELGGYDSPPLELADDGLLDMLSLDKDSDSDIDDEPSMVSLILPVTQSSPKRAQPSPSKKKRPTPQKRFAKKGGPPLDFNFTNAEAKRQAKVAEAAARAEQDENDEADSEPEPMPLPISTPKKHLKRRTAAAKSGKATAAIADKRMMAAVANSTTAIKPKKGATAGRAKPAASADSTAKANKGAQGKTKPQLKSKASVEEEEDVVAPTVKRKTGGNGGKMTIKQRLANAELLARMNKMQDINTPKVMGKKTKKAQRNAATKTLATKRAEFRKALASDPAEPNVPRRNQDIEDGDLNISLNSSGLISDDSPGNLRAPTRKRPREVVDGEVTPTKKLQFLEITKRLTKSPMPRFLRTPTPLMSPVIASSLVKPRAASPAPRTASSRATVDTAAKATRRMNSAPVRPKKTTNVNRFGIPGGGANTAASSGGFSMFDAFVNSGSSGAIPRLKTKTPGNMSPSV